jgi:hypothetical protein
LNLGFRERLPRAVHALLRCALCAYFRAVPAPRRCASEEEPAVEGVASPSRSTLWNRTATGNPRPPSTPARDQGAPPPRAARHRRSYGVCTRGASSGHAPGRGLSHDCARLGALGLTLALTSVLPAADGSVIHGGPGGGPTPHGGSRSVVDPFFGGGTNSTEAPTPLPPRASKSDLRERP